MAGWEEELGLNNVLPFDRPMTAGSKDRIVGQDELGQTIYETPTGQRYTVRPATEEESKTTRAKAEEWVEEGAPLPSWDQIVDTIKAIPGAMYDSAASAVRGKGTVGDALAIVPTSGAAGMATRIGQEFDPDVLSAMGAGPNTSEITSLAVARERKQLSDFSKKLKSDLKNRVEVIKKLTSKAREEGVFTGFDAGDRFLTKNGPLEVVGTFLRKVKPDSKILQEAFKRFNIKPQFIEVDGDFYLPMIRTRTGDPKKEGDWSEGDAYLDLMREANYPKMGQLRPVAPDTKSQQQTPRIEEAFSPQQARIREDDVFRGNGPITTSLDKATKPFAVRLTGESQIEDMIKSGLVRPKEGGYGQDQKAILYFGEMDEPVPTSVFTKPKDDPNKNYTIVMDSTKAAGREGPIRLDELQHVWTTRDGELVDVLPELLVKNRTYKPKFAEGGMVEQPMMDPVSKNPVPTGATPKEVRDDVPIMASEGEYVIPANVVRYLGLDKIEKLVNQAKKGLEELEMKGRIGGQTEEDLPFSAEELQTVEQGQAPPNPQATPKMATGGMVLNQMDIDQATGLPTWLVNMQRRQRQPQAVAVPEVPSAETPAQPTESVTNDRGADRQPNTLTGLAADPKEWDVNTFNKYATARTGIGQNVGQAFASLVPFGGIASRARERYLERTVPTQIEKMLSTGKDVKGNPLSTEQTDQLRNTLDTIRNEPVSRIGGAAGVARAIGQDLGLIRRRDDTTPAPSRAKEKPQQNTSKSSGKSDNSPRPVSRSSERTTERRESKSKQGNTAR